MELTAQQYENIQKYLDGEMSPDDEKVFLDELNMNATLQENLEFEQNLRENIESITEKNISEVDFNIEKKFNDAPYIKSLIEKAGKGRKSQAISIKSWIAIGVAASSIIAVSIIWLLSPDPKTQKTAEIRVDSPIIKKDSSLLTKPKNSINNIVPSPPNINLAELYNKFFKKENVPEEKPVVLAEALMDYENEEYKTLQNLDLNNLPADRGPAESNEKQYIKELGHYFKGLSFIETNEDQQAIKNLQWVIDSANNKQLLVKAQWYLALINIKKGNNNKAIPLLNTVANNKVPPYNRQAKELLKLLKP